MYTYTKKQINQVMKEMHVIVKDLNKLYKRASSSTIVVPIKHGQLDGDLEFNNMDYFKSFFSEEWRLIIKNSAMIIETFSKKQSINFSGLSFLPFVSRSFEKDRMLYNLPIFVDFVENYSENRENIVTTVENSNIQSKRVTDELNDAIEVNKKTRSQNQAQVRLSMPESIDTKNIEISKEKGQTVGKIDFGDKTIEIITTDDIVLVPPTKNKQKVKK